jgi:hypothetical protein
MKNHGQNSDGIDGPSHPGASPIAETVQRSVDAVVHRQASN